MLLLADGWELARRESEPGMAALVRDLFQREVARQSRPPQPSRRLEFRHYRRLRRPGLLLYFVRWARQAKACASAPYDWCGGGGRLLVPQGPARHYGDADAPASGTPPRVPDQLGAAAAAALRQDGGHTWKGLVRYMDHLRVSSIKIPDSHALATFVRAHHGPTRAGTSVFPWTWGKLPLR